MSLVLCSAMFWYGMLVRSWHSFKTLKDLHTNPRGEEELRELLEFWTCYGILALYDFYFELFVSWIPFYHMVKLVFLWYIITPATRGASVVFEKVLEPKLNEKLFNLERAFVVDGLSNFVELDWLYEQLTVQIGTRLYSVSQDQLSVIRTRVDGLKQLIDIELDRRARAPSVLPSPQRLTNGYHVQDEDEFEVVHHQPRNSQRTPQTSPRASRTPATPASASSRASRKSATPVGSPAQNPSSLSRNSSPRSDREQSEPLPSSPQEALMTAMNAFRDTLIAMRGGSPHTPGEIIDSKSTSEELYYERELELFERRLAQEPPLPRYPQVQSANFQPSYFPTRGIRASPQRHQNENRMSGGAAYKTTPSSADRNRTPQQTQYSAEKYRGHQSEEEDMQEATLRSLELDENNQRSRSNSDDGDSILKENAKGQGSSPSSIFKLGRFSWMSPRWPSFGASPTTHTLQVESTVEEEERSFKRIEREQELAAVGPVTRSRARRLNLSKESDSNEDHRAAGGLKQTRKGTRRGSSSSLN